MLIINQTKPKKPRKEEKGNTPPKPPVKPSSVGNTSKKKKWSRVICQKAAK